MPKRGTLLTDYEKGTIDALLEEKKPVKEIATRLGRSYKCLYIVQCTLYTVQSY